VWLRIAAVEWRLVLSSSFPVLGAGGRKRQHVVWPERAGVQIAGCEQKVDS